ncbi:MAG: hypothetical protein A2297_00510 [Elusimicrobia bacterium RIFOXYB2_FULL_48_7]|nr:MAG: hypothetical protein A2297_00510 [Elusimicrobia bacterium RIFOXYB2_FULL_48_7]
MLTCLTRSVSTRPETIWELFFVEVTDGDSRVINPPDAALQMAGQNTAEIDARLISAKIFVFLINFPSISFLKLTYPVSFPSDSKGIKLTKLTN